MADTSLAHPARSGIYEIVNTINGKRYVGSAVNLAHRWRQHRCELGKGRHNPHMQNAWKKHGETAFEFRVIEFIENKANLISREQFYIDTLKPEYNCAAVAGSNLGIKFGPHVLEKMSQASRRIWAVPGHREKMSKAHIGQVVTAEQRAKISATNTGRKLSASHLKTIAKNNSERNRSEKHRALMSEFWKGKSKTPDQIAKMAATKRGQILTEEHKQKVRDGLRKAYLEGRRAAECHPKTREKIGQTLAKLTDDQVRSIRSRWRSGVKQRVLMGEFGLSVSAMSMLCNEKTYRWVADK